MTNYRILPPSTVLSNQVEKAHQYADRLTKHTRTWGLSRTQRRRLEALLGIRGCRTDIRLSDIPARIRSMEIMQNVVENFFTDGVSVLPNIYHITFADDIGLTPVDSPVLKLQALRRKIYQAIRALGLSGIVVIEIQPLINASPFGKGKTLMMHGHAFAWGTPSRRKFQESLHKINHSRSWKNHFGAKPVLSLKRSNGVEDAMKLTSYITKLPFDATFQVPAGRDGEFRFRSTTAGYSNALALRVAEGLSHYSIFDAVFSVGEGKHIRKQWKRELVAWHNKRAARGEALPPFCVASFWKKVRKQNGNRGFMPYTTH